MGILGVVTGALLVLQIVPVVPVIIQAFWLGALGTLYLDNWPGGRGPAWESGEADPWPTPRRRGAQQADGDGSGESLLDPSSVRSPSRSGAAELAQAPRAIASAREHQQHVAELVAQVAVLAAAS